MDPEVVENLRRLAAAGAGIAPLVDHLQQTLNLPRDEPMMPVFYFHTAFYLDLNDALELGLWQRFRQGSFSEAEISRKLMPLILANKDRWRRQDS